MEMLCKFVISPIFQAMQVVLSVSFLIIIYYLALHGVCPFHRYAFPTVPDTFYYY